MSTLAMKKGLICYFDYRQMEQGGLYLGRIKGPFWCGKCIRNLAILAYAWHIRCCMANIGGLACISRSLFIGRCEICDCDMSNFHTLSI